MAMAGAAAHAGTHAAVRLRALCASAAASIGEECDHVLKRAAAPAVEGNSAVGAVAGDDSDHVDAAAKAANGDMAGRGLADCGEPLVHLLSRQASRLFALYEAAMPLSPSPSSPVPVGTDGCAVYDDGLANAAVRPSSRGTPQLRVGDGLVLKRLDDIISIAYSKFYAYLYKDLPTCWRQLYTDASILKFGYLFLSWSRQIKAPGRGGVDVTVSSHDTTGAAEQSIHEMVRTLDLALILAGAGGDARGRKWIDTAFDLFEKVCGPANAGDTATTARATSYGVLRAVTASEDTTPPPEKRARLDSPAAPGQTLRSFSTFEPFTPPVRNPVRRISAGVMDMVAFQQYLDRADRHRGPEPLILTGLLEDWPARGPRPWHNPDYLLSRTFGGRRLVPVEIGRSYVDEGWGQKIVTFGEFLRNHIDPASVAPPQPAPAQTDPDQAWQRTPAAGHAADSSDPHHPAAPAPAPPSPPPIASRPPAAASAAAEPPPPPAAQQQTAAVAYLAQHQLFLQLPQLRNDVLLPDHCFTSPPPHPTDRSQDQPELGAPLLNAWLGPPGTITPLHTDPYHNLLAQVVGRKYVRLYSPVDADGAGVMRARGLEGGVDMGNTSAWDVGELEGWDVDPGNTSAVSSASGVTPRDEKDDGDRGIVEQGPAAGEENDKGAASRRAREQFRAVPFVDCILEPGDTLYIPIGWWHYVRGLSVSFSVSLWWNGTAEDY
jgi:hypothetical protein